MVWNEYTEGLMTASLEFPCEFDFKVFGFNNETFESTAIGIVREEFPELKATDIHYKHSKNDKYLSLTLRVHATSQAQIDKVYQKFSDSDNIIMSL